MADKRVELIAVLVCALAAPAAAQVTQTATDTPVAGPNPGSTVDFALSDTVDSVELELELSQVDEVTEVRLQGPDLTTVVLLDFIYVPSSTAPVYAHVVQSANETCTSLCFSGCGAPGAPVDCRPDEGTDLDLDFDTKDSAGNWILSVDSATGPDPQIAAWSLTLGLSTIFFADGFERGDTSVWSSAVP